MRAGSKAFPGNGAALFLTEAGSEAAGESERAFTTTVNAVSAKLTLNAIVAMNKAVSVDKQSPAAVAKAFLKANGLL